jgi:hypothetical protein
LKGIVAKNSICMLKLFYTVAGEAIGFALEQPIHVVAIACPASRILKRL